MTIIRPFLIRSFVNLCSSSHQDCGSSSFDSRLPLNITSREVPRTIIFVREHANVSTITTVHLVSFIAYNVVHVYRDVHEVWSRRTMSKMSFGHSLPSSSLPFLFFSLPSSRFRYPSVVSRVVNRLIISNPEAELELIKNNSEFLSSSFYFP